MSGIIETARTLRVRHPPEGMNCDSYGECDAWDAENECGRCILAAIADINDQTDIADYYIPSPRCPVPGLYRIFLRREEE